MAFETLRKGRDARRVALLELNALAASGAWGRLDPAGLRLAARGTPIYDLNGELLFHRFALHKGDLPGWADVAASSAFASPLIATSFGVAWEPAALIDAAARVAGRGSAGAKARIVAYSFPKVAVQFLEGDREVALIEAFTGLPVPRARRKDISDTPPSNFERWSLLDSIGPKKKRANDRQLQVRLDGWDDICPPARWRRLEPRLSVISPDAFQTIFKARFRTRTRELHYSARGTDHAPCYEVRGQLTNVWCVAASAQMILDFYRYEYTQDRIAAELGLGTQASPNGLPYSRDGDVVTALVTLSSNSLTAAMNTAPRWQEFVDEIEANRPLVSFVPGHSRTVAGYTVTRWLGWYSYRGLLVYDPWPPTSGVITRWEDFTSVAYRVTFTAHVTLA